MTNRTIIMTVLFLSPLVGTGGELFAQRITNSSQLLDPGVYKSVMVPFRVDADINQCTVPAQPVEWGMDTAWDWDVNVVRGTNFIGKNLLKIGRVSFQTTDLLDDNGNLSTAQKTALQSRLDHIALSGVKDINLNSDQDAYYSNSTYVSNYKNNPENWYKLIKATVMYCRDKGFNVVSVSPFNEPDYTAWNQGSQSSFKAVAKLISEDSDLAGIRICAGNTLNCDNALSWYNAVKPYVNEGNTHQLAGTMANYTSFFSKVCSDGNIAVADELHNTMEAFIAAHYGMTQGIWWGWEGACRGEYCKASALGKEIGYGENSDNWTGAAVYKWNRPANSDGSVTEARINAFVGASERQAKPSTFELVSTDRPIYFESYGPTYSFSQFVTADPNGNYQSDLQKNAERMIGVQYGEDVPTDYICMGDFVIMNASSQKCLSYTTSSTSISQNGYYKTPTTRQYWTIDTIAGDCGGDFGYYTLRTPGNTDGRYLTTSEEWSLESGKGIQYATNWASAGRNYWFFEYAGENFWYIRNKYTGLYLQPVTAVSTGGTAIVMKEFTGNAEQKWRFIPVPADVSKMCKMELIAPAVPTGLKASALSGSVKLDWMANSDADIAGYNVLRSANPEDADSWDVIGRMVDSTAFLDNDVTPGKTYAYKLKAVDCARNQSVASDIATIFLSKNTNALIAHYSFDGNAKDTTENIMDAVIAGTETYNVPYSKEKEGTNCLYLDGTTSYAVLPPAIGNMSQMTIAMWVFNSNSSTSWNRIFDFGNGTDQYFFLTPNNGSEARLVMKNKGDEQILSTTKIGYGWHHIAVTLSSECVCLYVDGNMKSSTSITIRPSDFAPKRNYIGRSQFVSDPLLKGYIDDLRIYNYPLSASDISLLINGDEPSAIMQVSKREYEDNKSRNVYNISGQQVKGNTTGIIISNGKKLVKK